MPFTAAYSYTSAAFQRARKGRGGDCEANLPRASMGQSGCTLSQCPIHIDIREENMTWEAVPGFLEDTYEPLTDREEGETASKQRHRKDLF
jgi:hypothetical protein